MNFLGENFQKLLFSATFSAQVENVIPSFLNSHLKIMIDDTQFLLILFYFIFN